MSEIETVTISLTEYEGLKSSERFLDALQSAGVVVNAAELAMEPKSVVEVAAGEANRLLRLVEELDELDDVEEVHSNFDVPEEVLEAAAAG